jgi:hypothetical protein
MKVIALSLVTCMTWIAPAQAQQRVPRPLSESEKSIGVKRPTNFAECMANGSKMSYSAAETAAYCSRRFSR